MDHADGPLVRTANRRLRAALLQIADNLLLCNGYFHLLGRQWTQQGCDQRHQRVRVAKRFSRLAFLRSRQLFTHAEAPDPK